MIDWLEPWRALSEPEKPRLEIELSYELALGHVLFGRRARALAVRVDCDDVLFELLAPPGLAVVHLSYAERPDRPPWPTTELFADAPDFIARRMKPDHADYTA